MKLIHINISETKDFAINIASKLRGGEVILLEGDLGAGKTHFTKFLGEALGIKENIKSPTFVFFQKYKGKELNLYHFDLYRMQSEVIDPNDLGIVDALEDEKGVVVIEWANLVDEGVFKEFLKIKITTEGEKRELQILSKGEKYEKLVQDIV
jgi:tRNA threonylcarbamoyladenosine biosynthesis protein TsaE